MSLNGLDDVKVKEAHDAANAEPSGWFLLKYASRDEIDILDTGSGGISDIRNAIEKYEEPSPLYGFLRYRRRSVIIKYIPEDCSRLVQARAAVHFNAICDQFAHNATFEISAAKDLKDSKLSAACSLHAASGSSSSSTSSLRRRRLNEIAEEEEEEEREKKRQSVVKEEGRPSSSVYSNSPPSSLEPPVVLNPQHITDPPETAFASTKTIPDFTGANVPTSPTRSEFDRRLSSQSARYEVYSSASYSQGRKVKLGPRPSTEAQKRASTSENFRPTAALPAGFKFFQGSKKAKSQEQPQSEPVHYGAPVISLVSEPSPSTDDQLPPRPVTSSGASIKSTAPSMATVRESKLTPEKARLMKAMKLREKRLQEAKSELLPQTTYTPPENNATSNTDNAIESPISAATKPEAQPSDIVLDSHPSSPGGASSTGIGDSTKASSVSDLTDETVQPSKEIAENADEGVKDRTEEPSDTVEETDLQMGATGVQQNSTTDLANTSQPETTNINVSSDELTKGAGEFAQIPGSTNISTGAMISKSIEPDNPSPEAISKANLHDDKTSDQAQTYQASTDLRGNKASTATSDIDTVPQDIDRGADDSEGNQRTSKVQLEIPTSKFAKNEVKSPTLSPSPTTPSLKSKFSRKDVAVPTEPPSVSPDQVVAAPSVPDQESAKAHVPLNTGPEIVLASPPNPRKQKALVEPILTDLSAKGAYYLEPSDPFDDDALMDELQTATVQEAKPMLVSKSPITPVFPGSSSGSPPRKDARQPRAASNPMRGSLLMPVDNSHIATPRSASSGATFLNGLTRNPSNASVQSKKSNVGSSISQRIKALEALSGNPNEDRPRPATPSSAFFTVRKQSTHPAKPSSVVDRSGSHTRQPPNPEGPREPIQEVVSSKRERSGSVASRLSMFEGQHAPRGRPESIQVTARIIRGATSPYTNPTNASKKPVDTLPTELRHSTLLVDIHRTQSMAPQPSSERTPVVERPKTSVSEIQEQRSGSDIIDKQAGRRSSMSLMKSFIKEHTPLNNKSSENLGPISPGTTSLKSPSRPPSSHQTSSGFARRLSTSSRRSSVTHDGDNASISGGTRASSRVSDSGSTEDDRSLSDKKSKNRTSRFMRRLSNSFGGARKSGSASISPTVAEEEADQLEKTATLPPRQASSPTIVAFMGDVNVQFPDNLLWKRRSMCLDAQGFLFLSTVQGGAKKAKDSAGTKRFHLGDFRKPYIPDVEIQELPNSVVLDFVEGSCLQIACGDRAEQQKVLRTLQEAHHQHAN